MFHYIPYSIAPYMNIKLDLGKQCCIQHFKMRALSNKPAASCRIKAAHEIHMNLPFRVIIHLPVAASEGIYKSPTG